MRSKIEGLEEENAHLKDSFDSKCSELAEVSQTAEQNGKELAAIRDRANLSQQNWLKEKDELIRQESYLQSEFEQAKEAMHNWEVLAMEERSIRENLGEKVIDLEEQLIGLRDAYEKASADHESQLATVDGLQRALQDIQAGMMNCRHYRRAQSDGFQLVNRNSEISQKALIRNLRSLGEHFMVRIKKHLTPINPSKIPEMNWRGCGRSRKRSKRRTFSLES